MAAIFCAVAPHLGWRHVEERESKTRSDYAAFLRALAEEHFPAAERIVLVQDNLNPHSPASLYEAFPPAEAARLKARFEFHFTPKHGSWMNIAEIELSALARGCLARRIPESHHAGRRVACLAVRPPSNRERDPRAVHHRGCTRETRPVIPIVSEVTKH